LVNSGGADRPGLLDEDIDDLINCSSVNDGQKYYLNVGSHVYVWDYEKSPYTGSQNGLIWYFYDNINAGNWAYYNRTLYYGSRTAGNIVQFWSNFNDFGQPLDGIWKGKLRNFGLPDYYKTENEEWISSRSVPNTTLEVTFFSDGGEQTTTEKLVGQTIFDWDNFDWDNFTWDAQKYPSTLKLRPNLKKIINSQIQLRNNVLNENLSILALVTSYFVEDRVR
jgi:hypothetical protein